MLHTCTQHFINPGVVLECYLIDFLRLLSKPESGVQCNPRGQTGAFWQDFIFVLGLNSALRSLQRFDSIWFSSLTFCVICCF